MEAAKRRYEFIRAFIKEVYGIEDPPWESLSPQAQQSLAEYEQEWIKISSTPWPTSEIDLSTLFEIQKEKND